MARITDGVRNLVLAVLATLPTPYGEDLIRDVALAIENSPAWRSEWDRQVAAIGEKTARQALGSWVMRESGMRAVRQVDATGVTLIRTYSKLAVPEPLSLSSAEINATVASLPAEEPVPMAMYSPEPAPATDESAPPEEPGSPAPVPHTATIPPSRIPPPPPPEKPSPRPAPTPTGKGCLSPLSAGALLVAVLLAWLAAQRRR